MPELCTNGATTSTRTSPLTGTIANGDVFVFADLGLPR